MYWRRRVVAGVGIVVAVVAVILLIVALSGGSGDSAPDSKNAAAKSAATSTPPPPSTTPSAPASSEAPSGGGDHGRGGDPSATPSEPAPPPGDPAAQTGVPLCSDQSLSVVLYTDKPTYTVGDQPVFTIVTTNGGLAACTRDVGKAATNVTVRTLDGARTLWSAQDCAPDKSVNIQVLQPGQQARDDITWSGTTSSPGCKKKRVQIAPGGYQAGAKLGERESAPITFNVVAPAAPGA